MRHAFASLVLALFLFPSLALGETVKFNDLELRGDLYYKQSTDVLFTGKVTGRIQCSLKEGKLDGPFVEYHENGKIFEKGAYKDGKEEGVKAIEKLMEMYNENMKRYEESLLQITKGE